jgi:spore coat protein U-like protein
MRNKIKKGLAKFKVVKALSAIALLATVTNYIPAIAATGTGSFTASTSVGSVCTFSASNISFGAYLNSALTGDSTITANCTNGTSASFAITTATDGTGNTYKLVRVGGSDATINDYLLAGFYKESGFTNQLYLNSNAITYTGTGSSGTAGTIYGRVAASQGTDKAPGSFTKTLTVTVTY